MRVQTGLNDLRRVWSADLHRVAIRYKHSYPLLSGSYGVLFGGATAADSATVRDLYAAGALFVADKAPDGSVEQVGVDVTIGGTDLLLSATEHAIALVRLLVASVLERAEHKVSRVLSIHPLVDLEVDQEDLRELVLAFYDDPSMAMGFESESFKRLERAKLELARDTFRPIT